MFLEVFEYLIVFAISALFFSLFQKTYKRLYYVDFFAAKRKFNDTFSFCTLGCLSLFPVIAMYGLRYGIGTDYFAYKDIYDLLHDASLSAYWEGHSLGLNVFYVEPLYYVMNAVFPSYQCLLWGIGVTIYSLVCLTLKDYSDRLSYGFAIFVFLSTQFIYSMNGMRFSIATCFVLLAYKALINNKAFRFSFFVFLAALFHKSALFCLALFFLMNFKYNAVNKTRSFLLFVSILLFPLISKYLLSIVSGFSLFARYFSTSLYASSDSMSSGWTWILHVMPVILPLLLFARNKIFDAEDTTVLFRICVMEIPFRMLGLYNTWYTRFSRYAQIALVLFLPLVIAKINDKHTRRVLYIYYIIWFAFYFAYYAIVNDNCDSLPYVSIFTNYFE